MTNDTCSVDGCEKPRRGRLCSMHAERLRRHGSLEKPPPAPRGKSRPGFVPKYGPTCAVDDCGRTSHLRGLCQTHYKRWLADGDPGGEIEPRGTNRGLPCKIAECGRPARTRGWCQRHYAQWWESGGSEWPTGPISPLFREVVKYNGVHMRLRREFGQASQFPCVNCGLQAADWSYDHNDADELVDQNLGLRYSLNADCYSPRCKPCHSLFDRGSVLQTK